MLQNGGDRVYAVDVGHGQLAWKLRNDERVVCMEKTNFRYVAPLRSLDRGIRKPQNLKPDQIRGWDEAKCVLVLGGHALPIP